jgi:hypothetical protein
MISQKDIIRCFNLIEDLTRLIKVANEDFECLMDKIEAYGGLDGSDEDFASVCRMNEAHEQMIIKLRSINKYIHSEPLRESIKEIKNKCVLMLSRLDISKKMLEEYRSK